ncbi:MAG TPA: hypothetical protein VFE73_00865 [Reyranella sp.]|jgi:hypothetical protein|nr:hypothetical protein [Reyranella sp.]
MTASPASSASLWPSLQALRLCFLIALALATVGPLAVALVHVHSAGFVHQCAVRALRLLNILAAPHVVTTLYLMLDRRQLEGVPNPAITVYLVPACLVLLALAMLLLAPLWAAAAFMLAFIFYTMWHFGRQNVGITALAARVAAMRPLDRFERWTLNAGMAAGILGAYRAFAPSLMLPPDRWPFDMARVDPLLSQLWLVGAALYIVLIPAVAVHVIRRRRSFPFWLLANYLACVFFFLPIYLSTDPIFLVTSWTVAHGIQYLAILAFHAGEAGRLQRGARALGPLLAFGVSLAIGVGLWLAADREAQDPSSTLAKLLLATTIALTLAHYWIDQFLWRLRSPTRRAWLARSFSFLSGHNMATRASPSPS